MTTAAYAVQRIATDLCIIGGGSAGLSLAAGAVQMGARVVLLEGGRMGGDCLNFGCIPSKALIAASAAAHAAGAGADFGVAAAPVQVDYAAAMEHVAATIAAIAPHDSQERFEELGVRVIRAHGRFVSPREVAAEGYRISARRFAIASGSSPRVPAIPGLSDVPYLTNETIFDLRQRPEHLLVLGGGPVGVELAQAHRRLGSCVTVVEAAGALSREDPELAAVVLERLRAEGVRLTERRSVARVEGTAGAVRLLLEDGSVVEGTHLLLAAGRKANLDGLDLASAGVETADGAIRLGATLRTSNRRIFAIGDAAGLEQFTHVAGYHAGVVARSILFGMRSGIRRDHLPRVTFSDPPLAQLGPTEDEARQKYGARLSVVCIPYTQNDRAQTSRRTEGLVKVMVVRGRPVGASIVGASADELIAFWAVAVATGLSMRALAGTVLPYPTLGEVNKRVVGAYFSPKLFDNAVLKQVVRAVQRVLP